MKAKRIAFRFMFVTFLLSFFLLVYASWNIYSEIFRADKALREWEEFLTQNSSVPLENELHANFGNLLSFSICGFCSRTIYFASPTYRALSQ